MIQDTPAQFVNLIFTVNDQEVNAQVDGRMSLMRFLRDQMHLTGAKDGCSTGHCGTCTVILNGKAKRSCLVSMAKVNGARIETIEGLAQGGVLHPIQQAFIDTGAVQCGFCTPGMIMTAKALLDVNPKPSQAEIKQTLTLNHNLCRCTGYVKIIEAIQLAAQRIEKGSAQAVLYPGDATSNPLVEAASVQMVRGATRFADDQEMDGMLYGKILWAAYPRARILGIDTKAADSLEGVVRVITAKDIPGKNQAGLTVRDQPAIAADTITYIGDAVAAVFAERREVAEAALDLIKVDYEVLPGVFSPEEAARPDAPRIQPKGNLMHQAEIIRGDTAEGFARCAVIVEHDYTTPFIEHAFMEPESGFGIPGEDGSVTIKIGTQTAFDDRTQLSEILNLPEEKIRVIQLPIGGAFGAKEDMILQQYLALGALLTKRPVKMTLTRAESLRVHEKRHPAWMHYKTGADGEGHVLALEANIILDTGAYASLGVDILENTVVFGAGPYYIPNLKITGHSWYTNNVMAGAMRGFGVNQIAFALEQQMDAMARELGIDPFEFRLINALDVGLPTASDHILEQGVVSIKETIRAAREEFAKITLPSGNGKKIGVGVASAVKNIGYGHGLEESAGAIVELNADGIVTVRHSHHEYGQGAQAGILKLTAEELGLSPAQIRIIGPDTAQTPPTGPTTASRQTFATGNAVVMACQSLKEEIFGHASEILGTDPVNLCLQRNQIVDITTGHTVDLSEMGDRFVVERRYVPPMTDQMHPVGEASHFGKPGFRSLRTHFCYAYNTQVAIVEADPQTGEVQVLTVISANDVGKIINRQAVIGQIHGGVVMGLGFALSEQFLVENGINLTDTLHKCRIPTANQVPEIIPVIVEVPHPFGPRGVKGFAEAPSLATAPAIVNAIYDALGIRVYSLPADKKRILNALQKELMVEGGE